MIGTEGLPGAEEITLAVTWTVLISVYAHGLTAQPGASWYASRAEEIADEDEEAPEHDEVEEVFRRASRFVTGSRHRGAREPPEDDT